MSLDERTQGLGLGPRQCPSAIGVVEDMINRGIKNQADLLALKNWMGFNPIPKEVEEFLYNLLVKNRN